MPSSLPRFQIDSISVAASYDALDLLLDPRPTPQSLNDLLFQKVCDSIDLIDAEDVLQKLQAIEAADAKAAVLVFKAKVVTALNDALLDPKLGVIDLGGVTPYYRHTTAGTHEAVNWIMTKDGNGSMSAWELELEVDGSTITTNVALSVFISETSSPVRPTPAAPTPHHEEIHT